MRIIVVGGGIAGLGTALACARDGHEVTVLERDDTPMPPNPDAAFEWQRTGAPQVRHSHAFLARLRNLLREPRARRARRAARGGRERDRVHREPARDADRPLPPRRRRRAGRARVPAHDVRMGVAPSRAGRARRHARPRRRRAHPRRAAGPGPDRRRCRRLGCRPRGRRTRAALVVGRVARGDRRRARRRRGARERHRVLLALLPRPRRAGGAALRRADGCRPRLFEVRDLPRRQRHVLDHVRDRARRRGAPARARRRGGIRDGGPVAPRDRPVADRGGRRPDHRRAHHGGPAQPVPPAGRCSRQPARPRLRRGGRRLALHQPALRSGLQPRVRARVRPRRHLAGARRRSRRARRAPSPRSPSASSSRGSARRCCRTPKPAPCTRSSRPTIPARSCRPCSATVYSPRCGRRRSCSARSCAGSTCSSRPTR